MAFTSLTTTFSPPPNCLASFATIYDRTGGQMAGPVSTGSCLPPGYQANRGFFYSPGVCPYGYTSACSSLNEIGSLTQTAVTCCPTNFSCNPRVQYPLETTMGCTSPITSDIFSTTLYEVNSAGDVISTTVMNLTLGDNINAFSVQVRFTPPPITSASLVSPSSDNYHILSAA